MSESISLCFDFLNGSCPKFTYPPIVRFPLFVFFGSIIVLTVVGNMLVVVSVLHFRQLHTPTNFLIQSLALTDLLVGTLLMPSKMVHSVETCWYLGNAYCKIHSSLEVMLCNASILNLSFIAIDRYFAVCHPLSYHSTITPAVTVIMIFVIWCFPAVIGFGMVFLELNLLGVEEFFYNNVYCEGSCIFFQSRLVAVSSAILVFYVPGLIMICLYAKIFMVAQKQARTIKHRANMNRTGKQGSSAPSNVERKATKTLATVLGVFLAFWQPLCLCVIIKNFVKFSIPPLMFDLATWIACFNSICNPIIYALFYRWFRNALKIIVVGKIFQKNSSHLRLFS